LNTISPFGIYIHWPFCKKKCPYCDFNSHVQNNIDHDRWLTAYLNELKYHAKKTSNRVVSSVFFGGGTPSLMKAATIEKILNEVKLLWRCSETLEITAEANPSSAETQTFKDFQSAGINRLSIGVQSLNQKSLTFLGRQHSARDAKHAVCEASEIFSRVSFDLIYALPGQTPEVWEKELLDALKIASGHLSLYQLTIEPGTDFHKQRLCELPEDIGIELFELTQNIMHEANLPAYEISNHSIPGQECKHNLLYWRGEDYLGIGPGAHGRITHNFKTKLTQNYRDPEKWLMRATANNSGHQKCLNIRGKERRDEIVLMGLRLTSGISHDQFKLLTNSGLIEAIDGRKIKVLVDEGFLVLNREGLKATKSGRQRLNAVLTYLLN